MTLTIAVIGSVMMDVTIRTPRLPHSGENLYVHDLQVSAGGKGANAAVTLTRHGARVHLISNTGRDAFGAQIRAELAPAGVAPDHIGTHPDAPTGTVVMLAEDDGQTCYLAHPGASRTVTPQEMRERLAPLLPHLDGLFFNFEAPEDALQVAVEMALSEGIPLFVDAGPEHAYGAHLWQEAQVLSPNEPEAEALLGHEIGDTETAARELLAQGPAGVVLKLGARGAMWATDEGVTQVPAFAVDAVDPAGAGDAFTAGLTWALLTGQPLPAAVRWANACGALVTTRFGTLPAMPGREEVAAFLDAHPA